MRGLVRQQFGDATPVALRVIQSESGMNPKAINAANKDGSTDYGLFQINSVHLKRFNLTANDLLNPLVNTRVAMALYKERGWCPWVGAYNAGVIKTLYCQ